MISIRSIKLFCCEPPQFIENYEEAIKSNEQYDCHHRLEIDENHNVTSASELKKRSLYYHRPASELIFLRHSEHISMHMKNRLVSEKTRHKLSSSQKGKRLSAEHKQKIAKSHQKKYIRCIETDEVHYINEWIRLGFPKAWQVARGHIKSSKGLHFEYV